MYRKNREELVHKFKELERFDDDSERFYNLSHQEKVNEFEAFCLKHSGYLAIVLSDDIICDDKELVLIAKKYGFYTGFHLLSERLLCDPDIALALAKCNQYEYTNISKSLRNDPQLMLEAVKINPSIYYSLPVSVKINKKIIREIAKKDPHQLRLLLKIGKKHREPLQHDKELATIVAESNPGMLYEFFSEEILTDKDIQEIAFRLSDDKECKRRLLNNTWALPYVDSRYWMSNMKLIKRALYEDGTLLRVLPDEYRANKKLALIAVKSQPQALMYCSEKLLDDKDVICAALQEDSEEVLGYASERLQNDYDLVYKAVKVDPLNLQFASDELRDNRDIVICAIKSFGGALEDASERLQADEELIKIARERM